MRNVLRALLALCPLGAAVAQDPGPAPSWKFSGYFLTLYTRSTTVFPSEERFTLDLNRLRLRIDGRPFGRFALALQYDNEMLLGSYLRTPQFALTKDRAPETSFDLERTYVDEPRVVIRHGLYRATLSWSGKNTQMTLGRQRVALGTGRFWSPLDILNPFDASRLERTERTGVDVLRVERKLGALAALNAVFIPGNSRSRAIAVVDAHVNVHGTDYSAVVGHVRGADVIGGDFTTDISGVGIRGEVTATRPAIGRRFAQALLGADYGFANTLNVTGELHYNGRGASDPDAYDFAALFSGQIHNVARRYAGVAASYEIYPLLKIVGYGILNLDDGSHVLWPGVEYSLTTNVELALGVQRFSGGARTEYGRLKDIPYARAQWHF